MGRDQEIVENILLEIDMTESINSVATFKNDRVIKLNLNSLGLNELPDELSDLDHLRILTVENNKLLELPDSISLLKNLYKLRVDNNQLSQLPKDLGRLTSLKELYLTTNQLTHLPNDLSAPLTKLVAHNNQLVSVEDVSFPTSLTYLDLSYNNLYSIPINLQVLNNLKTLLLQNNRIDHIPNFLGSFTRLAKLDLSSNPISELPASFYNLSSLSSFSINHAQLSELSESIGQMTNLSSLYVMANRLKSLPQSLGELEHLKHLYVGENQLQDLPSSLKLNTKLSKLDLKGNPISYDIFGSLPTYLVPEVAVNHITSTEKEEDSDFVAFLKDMDILEAYQKRRSLPTPSRTPYQIDLSGLGISSLSPQIKNFPHIDQLDLSNNQLSTLPEEIGFVKELMELDLSNNPITSLPLSMSRLRNLIWLKLKGPESSYDRNYGSMFPEKQTEVQEFLESLDENKITQVREIILMVIRRIKVGIPVGMQTIAKHADCTVSLARTVVTDLVEEYGIGQFLGLEDVFIKSIDIDEELDRILQEPRKKKV